MNSLEGTTKYHKWYRQIIEFRKINPPNGYYECHHILPRCLGGLDNSNNLINLTAREHYICHLLLIKMYEPVKSAFYKLLKAYVMMANCSSNTQQRVKFNSRTYESLKQQLSIFYSNQLIGEKNPQWNTKWIFNPDLKINKKISIDEIIPNGWLEGRVINWDNLKLKLDKISRKESCKVVKCKIITPKKEKKLKNRVDLMPKEHIIMCCGCKKLMHSKDKRKRFCTRKCANEFRYNLDTTITIQKDNITKQIKPVNYPAYKKYGWVRQ